MSSSPGTTAWTTMKPTVWTRPSSFWKKNGPMLGRPYADVVHQSGFRNMKELRVQHQGRPYRILFVFDPRRCAYLILGGDKTGDDRWYDEWVPIADRIYKQHLAEIRS